MKRILPLTSGIAILSALLVVAAASKNDTVEQEILKIERQWIAASVKGDTTALEKIEADDYIIIDPSGTISTKAEDLKNVKSGDLKFDSMVRRIQEKLGDSPRGKSPQTRIRSIAF